MVDGYKMAMGYMYENVDLAKEKIKVAYNDKNESISLLGISLSLYM